MIFFEVILPVFIIMSLGFVGQRAMKMDITSVSNIAMYILTPPLIFRVFYDTKINLDLAYVAVYSVLLSVSIVAIVYLLVKCRIIPLENQRAMMMSTAFMNAGNMGAPVMLFAFGEIGFNYAMIINVFHSLVMFTLGIYIAAADKSGVKTSLNVMLKMPFIHAIVLAFLWQSFNLPMPENVYNTIQLVGDASIPLIIIVLGMQLAECKITKISWPRLNGAMFIRLLISPLIAYGIVQLLPVSKLWQQVMIIEAAMPTAALIALYALQFNREPDFVTGVTFFSTVASIFTLMLIIPLVLNM